MKGKEFVKNTLKYSFPTIVSAIIGIIFIPVITRIYPADEYGKISMFYSTGVMLAQLFSLGLVSSCIRFFYEPMKNTSRKEMFNFAFWTGLLITFVVALFSIVFFRNVLSNYLFGEDNIISLFFFFLYVISTILFKLQIHNTRLLHCVGQYNLLQVIYVIINKVFFILATVYSTDYFYSILVITLALLLEVSVLGGKNLTIDYQLPEVNVRKKLLAFSLPLLPADIAVILNNSVAKLFLGFYGDFASIGIISMATNVANMINILASAFGVYWGAFIYENYCKEQIMIKKIHNVILFLSILIIIGAFLFQDFLYLILGMEYRSSQSYFMLLILMPLQLLICETTSYGINLSNKTYYNLIISIISCAANIGISYFLYPKIGILAMAYGIAVSAFVQLVLKTLIGQHFYDSIENKWQTLFGIAAVLVICILNLFIYDSFKYRFLVSVLFLGLSFIVYRTEIIISKDYACAYVKSKFKYVGKF